MKIHTFMADSTEEIDRLVNEFETTHFVRATQTDMIVHGSMIRHKATVFYVDA